MLKEITDTEFDVLSQTPGLHVYPGVTDILISAESDNCIYAFGVCRGSEVKYFQIREVKK